MKIASAAILSTGTEILQGHYPDTNAEWIGAKLTALGIAVQRQMAAPDCAEDVADALAYLVVRYDLVLMTGGLGPTEDDLTRQAVCEVFGTKLVEDPKAWDMIVQRFALRGGMPPAANRAQALIPTRARTLYNKWGTAPGFLIDLEKGKGGKGRSGTYGAYGKYGKYGKYGTDGTHGMYERRGTPGSAKRTMRCRFFAALPGPPRENRPMFEECLEREIAGRFGGGIIARITTLHTFGISESALNDLLVPLFRECRDRPNRGLAFLAGQARVDLRVLARGGSEEEVRAVRRQMVERIRRLVPKGCIYGLDEETLESAVSRLLREKGLKLAVAESCTGGLVAKRITDLPGSSDVLLEGWVAYSNAAKRKRLGVRAATLERFGAVSSETAGEMAVGALRASGADVAVAITGIAGPGGGTARKPVGLVWYGLAWKEPLWKGGRRTRRKNRVETFRSCFPSGREIVRWYASHRALDLVRRLLLGLPLGCPNDPHAGDPCAA